MAESGKNGLSKGYDKVKWTAIQCFFQVLWFEENPKKPIIQQTYLRVLFSVNNGHCTYILAVQAVGGNFFLFLLKK